jgi:hypothetical protein
MLDFNLHHLFQARGLELGTLVVAASKHGSEVNQTVIFRDWECWEDNTRGQPFRGTGPQWVVSTERTEEAGRPEFTARCDNGARLGSNSTTQVIVKGSQDF